MGIACVLLVFCFVLLAAGPAAAIEIAGSVVKLQGSAVATAGTGTGFSRPLQEGSTILVGDRVSTGADSRLRLRMTDGAVVTLGSTSTILVETWDEDASTGRALLNVVEGVFLAASGAIARLGPDRMVVTTPVATLGIRGTDVWGDALPDRLAVALLSGSGVVVTMPQGSIEMTAPGSGLDIVAGEALPPIRQWGAQRLQDAAAAVAFADE
jgi:hypothetical protein